MRGGKAVLFSSAKAREMLALLVDRGGGFMTHEELIARLWPGEPVNALTLARCRKIAMRLKNTLREYGVEDIVEAAKSRRRIAAERVEFDFARASEDDMPHGEYMKGYAWARRILPRSSCARNRASSAENCGCVAVAPGGRPRMGFDYVYGGVRVNAGAWIWLNA